MDQPVIQGAFCIGCSCCVDICCQEVIKISDGIAVVVNSNKCVGCRECELICPMAAIQVVSWW